ncbi:MAG: dethiobiotin synthase [Deltaproteobacteria bacterium]|nr:dethiobiotin synthase [Deltaproteobacteria bacterium]NND27076.1 dethiobiotin synthase [Myxococcales bacterium]MBT8466667.1 dethiobiotin synthase [Deltaproteobacteria bacterium]MBT8481148.1 dethiobiotin synthase [Deltaproteobacteria bacterium]NNK09204.1 dethiobiotin synthase [Myxococcales bacterium]
MKGAFITATGTGVGKTWLASALASACVQRGKRVAAIKPMETGVDPEALDALALARACGDPSLANADGLYRAKEPLAPYAIEKRGGPTVGSLRALAKRVRDLGGDADYSIVEGVGGVLVPLNREQTVADFAALLDLQTVLVARNELGVLSYTLSAVEALRKRKISVRAIVLNHVDRSFKEDLSRSSNADVLADYIPRVPILRAPRVQSPADLVDTASLLLNTLKV